MVKLSLPHPVPIKNPTSPFRNFNFMRPIKIVGSDTDLHDYQVRIHLDRSNFPLEKCKPDGSDIRFRDDSGEILPYWIERWNAAEGVIWCKISFIPAESSKFIWMIYGNPNAKSESNAEKTFKRIIDNVVCGLLLNEGRGNIARDTSGNNKHGDIINAIWSSDGRYAYSLEFSAEDDYVDLPLDIVFDDEMSIEILFEMYDNTDGGRVIGSQHSLGSKYEFWNLVTSSKVFYFYVGNGIENYYVTLGLDDWYIKTHGVWTWEYDSGDDQTTLKSYKNGEYKNQKIFSGKVQLPDMNLKLGHEKTSGMKGKIYMARFYHKVLSEDEISDLANGYGLTTLSYPNHVLVSKYVSPPPVVIV